jgi:hypothetical protein
VVAGAAGTPRSPERTVLDGALICAFCRLTVSKNVVTLIRRVTVLDGALICAFCRLTVSKTVVTLIRRVPWPRL